ncbi:MAG: replicative DNA helicase [Maricaulaceae bacterium]
MPDGSLFADVEREDGLPPHDIDAEQAVLGAILFDNETYYRVTDFLKPEHFYEPVHGRIYEAAASYISRGDVADAITLSPLAESDAGLKSLGGKSYLVDLMAGAASTASAFDHARFVYDLALRRDLIRVGGDIEQNAKTDRQTPARELMEDAERKLFDLAETGSTNRGFVPFTDALSQSIEMAAAAYARDGHLSGLSCGISDLDDKLGGLHKSDLIILAGRPSMGKSALATNIAFNVARRFRQETDETGEKKTVDGGVVALFSLEMSSEQLATRLLAEYSEVPSHRIRRGDIDERDFNLIRDAAHEIAEAPLHIDDTGGLSISQLAARARRLKRTKGLNLIVVDYLQLVTASGAKKTDSRVQEVSEITMGLKSLAKELDVPVIALSQLSRQVENRDDKRPQLSDLRESGSIEQDADVVMFVYREAYYVGRQEPKTKEGTDEYEEWKEKYLEVHGKAEVIVSKQRHGPIGSVVLQFQEELTKFSNLEPPERRMQDRVHPGPSHALTT